MQVLGISRVHEQLFFLLVFCNRRWPVFLLFIGHFIKINAVSFANIIVNSIILRLTLVFLLLFFIFVFLQCLFTFLAYNILYLCLC